MSIRDVSEVYLTGTTVSFKNGRKSLSSMQSWTFT